MDAKSLDDMPERFGFELLHEIARSSGSVVYQARDRTLDRLVAVKIIDSDDTSSKRLHREAQIASSLKHPYIIEVYSFGRKSENQFFLAMEYMPGGTLGEELARTGPLSVERIKDVFGKLLEGLRLAHSQGVIHRDIKPANILLSENGEPKLSDFGIARVLANDGQGVTITQTGAVVGTPYYISPEQCFDSKVDARSDIYSLGAVLCQCLTGTPPFDGNSSMDLMYKHIHEPLDEIADRLKQADPHLAKITLTCLAKRPEDRYQSVDALLQALSNKSRFLLLDDSPQLTTPQVLAVVSLIAAVIAASYLIFRATTTPAIPTPRQVKRSDEFAFEDAQKLEQPRQKVKAFTALKDRAMAQQKPWVAACCLAHIFINGLGYSSSDEALHTLNECIQCLRQCSKIQLHFENYSLMRSLIKHASIGGFTDECFLILNELNRIYNEVGVPDREKARLLIAKARLFTLKGNKIETLRNIAEAEKVIDSSDVDYLEAEALKAQTMEFMGKRQQAIKILTNLEHSALGRTGESSDVAEALDFAGNVLMDLSKGKDGEQFFHECLATAENDKDDKFWRFNKVNTELSLAWRYYVLWGDCPKVDQLLADVAKSARNNIPPNYKVSWHDLMGEVAFCKGDFTLAAEELHQVINSSDKDYVAKDRTERCRALWLLGLIEQKRGHKAEASNYFERAIKLGAPDSLIAKHFPRDLSSLMNK